MKVKVGLCPTNRTTEYPAFSMLLTMALILLSPFVSPYLCYLAFLLCLYRMVRYDAKVFATDYCILLPTTQMFQTTGGMTFLIWLCLIAAIRFLLSGKIRANAALVFLLLLLNYLILRMQMAISEFVLCFGQIFILYVLLPKQDTRSAERTAKAFCWSVIVTSLYALVFRNAPQILAIRGPESFAIWGTSIMRFSGLIRDPNYYMTMLVTGMAVLCKLKELKRIRALWFWGQILVMAVFGTLTYSKTFFLMSVFLGCVYILWQFWSRKYFKGLGFSLLGIAAGAFLLFSPRSPAAVVLERLTFSSKLSDITTGRSDLLVHYWEVITESVSNFLFGLGLNAPILGKGTHMLYLELMYYSGILGLLLIVGFIFSMILDLQRNNFRIKRQSLIEKYAILLIVAVQYLSLQGMFQVLTYGVFFVALLSLKITAAVEDDPTPT